MKNHKEKYRLERIIRIRSAFHKIPYFWGLFKKILARPPMPTTRWSFYQPIYQFASLWNSMPTTSDSSMKRDAIWGSYHVSFIASPLSLPCSMALKPYLSPLLQSLRKSNHQHTHTSTSLKTFSIYRWNLDDPTKPEPQDYQTNPKRPWNYFR